MLEGYKTKLGLLLTVIIGGLVYTKIIDEHTAQMLFTLSAALTGYGIYDKVDRTAR